MKSRKISRTEEIKRDRISALPDEILCYVLAFLPTKYAVGTSILSKRWRFLWTSAPILDFDDTLLLSPAFQEAENHFLNFVERVLSCHSDVSCIQKFGLRCFGVIDVSRIYKLLCATSMPNVKELHLDFCTGKHIQLPHNVYDSCGKLQVLKLSGDITVDAPPSLCFSSLKTLQLTLVNYKDDDSLQKLLVSSPILEDLHIQRFKDCVQTLYVCSSSLKNLEIHSDVLSRRFLERNRRVVLETPNLEHLRLRDHTGDEYIVNDLSSLLSANLDFKRPLKVSSLLELLKKISNIEQLQLSNHTVDILEDSRSDELPLFPNLTRMKVGISKVGKPIVSYLLECSPNLVSFKMEKVSAQPGEGSSK